MNEGMIILNEFLEKFELNIKDNYLEENLVRNLESQKIKIMTIFHNNLNVRYVKVLVSKVWNLCRMLNYSRSIRDIDNNYYLLRLKNFLCDLYILIFSSVNDITLSDVFNLIQLITEVGSQWIKLNIKMSTCSWIKKVDNIMSYLISRVNDVDKIIHLERKFYANFMDYINFYIENFILNPGELISSGTFNLFEETLKIIILIKNIKFLENDPSTKNFVINFVSFLKKSYSDPSSIENVIILCEGFDSIKYKFLLSFEIIYDFYKFYVQILIDISNLSLAESVIKNLFEIIPTNSKEEIECYLFNLEISSRLLNDDVYKNRDIIEILFDHKEFNIEFFEDLIILANNLKFFVIVIEILSSKMKNSKNLKLCAQNNFVFNYENLKNFKILCFLFVHSFFKSNSNVNENLHSVNFFEILKIFSQCLLDNYANNNYDEDQSRNIPILLKNLVIFFLKIEKQNENFSSYFLIEIIKKLKDKQFIELSLEIYIQKKDFIKLKNILKELEEDNSAELQSKSALFYYSQIILIIKDGIKWNSHGRVDSFCLNLNKTDDFNMVFYLKIFNFLFECNMQDYALISIILNNFTVKFFELLDSKDYIKLSYEDKSKNRVFSFFDILFEILSFYCKLSSFPSQIVQLIEVLNTVGNFVQFLIMDEKSHYITSNITIILEVINIVLNYKSKLSKDQNFNFCEDYPEFILIFSAKLLHFVFSNFVIFSFEFFNLELQNEDCSKRLNDIIDLFELYKNLSYFYISYEFTNLNSEQNIQNIEKFKDLEDIQNRYTKTFITAVLYIKNKFSSNTEQLAYIEEKINLLNLSSISIENVLNIQIKIKTTSEEDFEEYVMEFINSSIGNKKFLFVINSTIYFNGNKKLSYKFIKKLLSSVMNSFQDMVPKVYSLEEIFMLYKDYVNLSENYISAINNLKDFTVLINKMVGKIDDFTLGEQIEWILYKIFSFLDNSLDKITKSDKEFTHLKLIYDDLYGVHLKNKSYMLTSLFDIVMKKFFT